MNQSEEDVQRLLQSVEREEHEAEENERHAREAKRKYRSAASLPNTMEIDQPPVPGMPAKG